LAASASASRSQRVISASINDRRAPTCANRCAIRSARRGSPNRSTTAAATAASATRASM
jgi:hypothetical protein